MVIYQHHYCQYYHNQCKFVTLWNTTAIGFCRFEFGKRKYVLSFDIFSSFTFLLRGAWQHKRPRYPTKNWMSSGNSSSFSRQDSLFTLLRTLGMCVSRCLEVEWATRSRGAKQKNIFLTPDSKSTNRQRQAISLFSPMIMKVSQLSDSRYCEQLEPEDYILLQDMEVYITLFHLHLNQTKHNSLG